ncbi:hypothetical protein DFH09DRAFT_196890 [Mycena vulgaris]|nr:hypothetical protein DFH09DRAFT_196890 [Mycena vulgaris]
MAFPLLAGQIADPWSHNRPPRDPDSWVLPSQPRSCLFSYQCAQATAPLPSSSHSSLFLGLPPSRTGRPLHFLSCRGMVYFHRVHQESGHPRPSPPRYISQLGLVGRGGTGVLDPGRHVPRQEIPEDRIRAKVGSRSFGNRQDSIRLLSEDLGRTGWHSEIADCGSCRRVLRLLSHHSSRSQASGVNPELASPLIFFCFFTCMFRLRIG